MTSREGKGDVTAKTAVKPNTTQPPPAGRTSREGKGDFTAKTADPRKSLTWRRVNNTPIPQYVSLELPAWLRLAALLLPLLAAFALGWLSRGGGARLLGAYVASASRQAASVPLLRWGLLLAAARWAWRAATPYEGTLRRLLGLVPDTASNTNTQDGLGGRQGAVFVGEDDRAAFDAEVAHWRERRDTEWELICDKAAPGLRYQAWRRWSDDRRTTRYMSRTVIDDASAAEVTAFYLDDAARMAWDGMLVAAEGVGAGDAATRSAMVRWVRRFPIFCSNREYYIGQRVYDERDGGAASEGGHSANGTVTTVTVGLDQAHVPQRRSLFRVRRYLSAWTCRPDPETPSACETILLHHEDMGVQRDVARVAVKSCMWGFVKNIGPSARRYIDARRARMGRDASMRSIDGDGAVGDAASDLAAGQMAATAGRGPVRGGLRRLRVVAGVALLAAASVAARRRAR